MTNFQFKACSKCQGDVWFDEPEQEWVCIQGGHRFSGRVPIGLKTRGRHATDAAYHPEPPGTRRATAGGYKPLRDARPKPGG